MQETSWGDKLGSKQETSDKLATSLKCSLSPCNLLFSFIYLLKGDKETSKIETTGYREKGQYSCKTGHLGVWKSKYSRMVSACLLVSSTVFWGALA